jgi:acetyl esterase/lipase
MTDADIPVQITKDIPFRVARNEGGEDESLALDVYAPSDASSKTGAAILWLHGGGFKPVCTKEQSYIVALSTAYARKGYVSVASEYRRRREPARDRAGAVGDAVEDGAAALAWIVEHAGAYGIDPARIAIAGGSAGGMLVTALLCAYADIRKRTTVPADLVAFINLWGSPARGALPEHIPAGLPPVLLVHGTDDELVPYTNAENLHRVLTDAGVRADLFTIPSAGHTPVGHMEDIISRIDEFLSGLQDR